MKTISVLFCLLCATWTVESDFRVEGFEWGKVAFRCSHSLASGYTKYLCRDPCTNTGHKLVSVEPGGRAKEGRITLVDSGNGVFNVTFTQLQKSDSGRYWCAVDRPGMDTYTKVYLSVKEVIMSQTTTTTRTYKEKQSTASSPSAEPTFQIYTTENISKVLNWTDGSEESIRSGIVVYVTVGSSAVVVVVVLSLVALATCCRKRGANSTSQLCSHSSRNNATAKKDCEDKQTAEQDNLSASSSSDYCIVLPDEETPASTSAATNFHLHIYANCKDNKNAMYLPDDSKGDCDSSYHIYANTLPLRKYKK
ncbi:uncharacterized protein LOC142996697 [Genypterus blacodes]|uniref:uncharacterized protein LOC142996697 n=1 Tax=Genypterus blacodes TaxID=154954 RepID=UPI003F76EED8